MLKLFVERPPNPLSLFSAGLDKRLGTTVEIHHDTVPTISSVSARNLENPYLNLFSQIDLVSIFQVVLSLLALLFAYDAIAGGLGKRHLAFGYLSPGPARCDSIRQISRRYDMPAAPSADESADGNDSAFPHEFNSTEHSRFSPNWGDSRHHSRLPICFLPDRTADFNNNPPHGYLPDALYVLYGSF